MSLSLRWDPLARRGFPGGPTRGGLMPGGAGLAVLTIIELLV
jgi:hypothetical protein